MSIETRERRTHPELDGEAEVDLGRYVSAVAARWWLPLAGLIVGALLGWLVSAGGEQVWRATALVYTGQPYLGNARVDTIATTPGNVREIATSQAVIARAAADAGLRPGDLRGSISVQQVTGGASRAQQALFNVGVTGDRRRPSALAANSIARQVTNRISGYADRKIEILDAQVAQAQAELDAIEQQVEALRGRVESGEAGLDALTLLAVTEQRRSTLIQSMLDRQQQLELARTVERASIVEPAVARQVTARSRRNTVVVAAALGLLLGLAAALAWSPVAARVQRP